MDWSQSQLRLFRTLLYCYPADFRHEYASEMEQLFEDRLAAEPSLRLWGETFLDLLVTAPKEHLHTLLFDVKHGLRVFASQPGFSAIAILVLALGIAASVSVFTLMNAVLFRSLPYSHPEQLVYLWSPNPNFKGVPQEMSPNTPDYFDWQRSSRSFSSMAALRFQPLTLVRQDAPSRLAAAFVTASFFRTLAVSPQFGRVFDDQEDSPGHEHVAVISDALWRKQFGASPDVLGRRIQLNRFHYTIVGVMPKEFGYPFNGDVPLAHTAFPQTDVWLPAAFSLSQRTNRIDFTSGDAVVARLRPGVSVAQAQAELRSIEARLSPLYPPMWQGFTALVRPLVETILGPVQTMFWLLLCAVGLVLLIAVSNVANLLLARTATRTHELGIRTALGAERGRIIRQLLTESLMLSLAGGTLGIALAGGIVQLLLRLAPAGIPRLGTATIDVRVILFALLLTFAVGLFSGLVPALSASRPSIHQLLGSGGTRIHSGFHRGRFALIAAQVALSAILLSSAGLLIRSYLQLSAVDPGFSPESLSFLIPLDDRYAKPEVRAAFYKSALDKFSHLPGVRLAGASDALPLTEHESVSFVEVQGLGRVDTVVETRSITPDYRKALGLALLRGRDFSPADIRAHVPVALVNRRFAAAYFKGRDPVGQRIRVGMEDLSHESWLTVVGVLADLHHDSLEKEIQPQVFQPVDSADSFALACDRPSSQVAIEARDALRSLDPALSLDDVRTMGQRIQSSNSRRTFQTTLFAGFAVTALCLALAGLYGLMAYNVRQRTSEIGIRLAVGSSRAAVLTLVLKQGLGVTTIGLLLGIASSLALTRFLSDFLFQVKAIDPPTFTLTALFLLAVALCACLVPAWSATRIDPVEALRQQ